MKRLLSFLMVALFSASMWADEVEYTLVGSESTKLGLSWDETSSTNNMTEVASNTYKFFKTFSAPESKIDFEYKAVKNHAWGEGEIPSSGNLSSSIPAGATSALFILSTASSAFDIFYFCTVTGDNAALLGKTWDQAYTANDMSYDNASNTYKITKSDVVLEAGNITLEIERNHDWAGKWQTMLNIPADGTYDVEISFNPYTHEVTAVATPQTPIIIEKQSIYYVNALDWATPKAHQWAGTAAGTSWPGATMDKTAETWNGHDVYKYEADPGDYAKCIFTNGASEGTLQTVDLVWTPNKYFIIEGSSDGKYTGTWYDDLASIPAPATFYVTGDSALVVDAGLDKEKAWNPKAIKATENVLVIKNLKEGVPYQIALTENGDWSTKKNYNDLSSKPACLRDEDGDNHNIGFTLKTAGDVTVTYTGSVFTIKGDFVMPTLALAGTFSEWSQLPMNIAADSLSASITVDLTVGVDSFKIVKDGAWLSLYGEDGNYRVNRGWPQALDVNVDGAPNFVIDVDKAGEYIFKWTYSEDSLFVTFPELNTSAVSITNLVYGSIIVKNGETSVASGANIQENTILTVTAASNNEVDYEVSNLRAFKTGDESTEVEINESTHQLTMPGYPITITADERENSYIMAGSLALFGAEWDATAEANKMTRQSNGTYQLVKTEVALTAGETYDYKLTRNGEYILPADGNYDLTNVLRSGKYTLTFTYIPSSNSVTLDTVLTKEEVVVPTVSIGGDFTSWAAATIDLEIASNKETASKAISLTEGIHVFQVVKGEWFGKNVTIKRGENTEIDLTEYTKSQEMIIWADVTGEYTFTWTYETSQLDITYPAVPSPASAWLLLGENVGGEGETWQTLVLTKAGDGKKASVAVNLEGDKDYEFKFIIGNDYRGLDGAESTKYTFHRGHKAAVGASGDSENNMLLQADWAGEYTFTWTYESNGISIGFPDEPDINYYIAGDFTKWGEEKGIMIESDGIWSASFDLEADTTYQFQVVKVQGSKETWYGANYEYNDMKYGDCSNWLLYTEAPRYNINLTTTKQASYPFYFEPTKQTVSVTIQEQGGETGVDNAEATVKAVKTLENGMLIIEKNGVRYNAQGVVVK